MLTRKLGEVYGFELTFHKARHNFGTHITLSMGIPIETVGKMMGHMRIETTQLYAKVTDKKVDEDMKRLKAAGLSQTSGLYEEDIIVKETETKIPIASYQKIKKRPCNEAVSFALFHTHRCSSLHLLYASSRTFCMSDSL